MAGGLDSAQGVVKVDLVVEIIESARLEEGPVEGHIVNFSDENHVRVFFADLRERP